MKQLQKQSDNHVLDSTYTMDDQIKSQQQQQQNQLQKPSADESEYYNDEELWRLMDVDGNSGSSNHSRNRPNQLDVYNGTSGYTPVVSRKPMFQFSGKSMRFLCVSIFCEENKTHNYG